MRADRLLKLAQFLKTVNPNNFDMRRWIKDPNCGTACCAMGWAGSIPEFRLDGLMSGWFKGDDELFYRSPEGPIYDGWEVPDKFFEISGEESRYLFDENRYSMGVSPNTVASRIESFVNSSKNL